MKGLLLLNLLVLVFGVALPLRNPTRVVVEPSQVIVDLGSKTDEKVRVERVVVTPEPISSVKGVATWYDATKVGAWYTRKHDKAMTANQRGGPYPFYAAAGPALRKVKSFVYDDKPYRVVVTSKATRRSIVAWVVDWCQCHSGTSEEAIIDLSPAAFRALGVPLDRGITDVTVAVID